MVAETEVQKDVEKTGLKIGFGNKINRVVPSSGIILVVG